MKKTIILRFRDLITDTIAEHSKVLVEAKEVWWGWWRKHREDKKLDQLGELQNHLESSGKTLEIGLYNRSDQLFYTAIINKCVFDKNGGLIDTPELKKTPEYYNSQKLPAWFKVTHIEKISQEDFVYKFINIPENEDTLFMVEPEKDQEESSHNNKFVKVNGKLIIHLSDIHFGSDFGFPAKNTPASFNLLDILEQDIKRQSQEKKIGLLIISGDLTSRGDANPLFNVAHPFLHELCEKIKINLDQVIIVPGNHDIPFKDFSLTYEHERAFYTFLEKFYGNEQDQIELRKFVFPDEQLVEILPINSVKLRAKELSNYGWVDWQAYENILENHTFENNVLRIAVLHHHIVPIVREEKIPDDSYPSAGISVVLNAGTVIEGLQRHGFRFVLHGHQHTPAICGISRGRYMDGSIELEGCQQPLFVIAGGSAGVSASRIDGDIRENTYGIYEIEKMNINVKVRQFNPANNPRDLFKSVL